MKSDELVRRINNGEIKDGTKIKRYGYGKDTMLYLCGKILRYKETDVIVSCDVLLDNEVEFGIVEEHKGWFKPKKGEEYWYTEDGYVLSYRWHEECEDLYRYKHHNVFRNPKEAQEYLDYKNALKEAEKPFVIGEKNWAIYYSHDDKEVEICWTNGAKHQGTTYLGQDKAVAQVFIDKWKKQILKYEFGIFE